MRSVPRFCRIGVQGVQRGTRGHPRKKLSDIGRAIYEKPPDAKKLAVWGLKPSDYPDKIVEIWPEHVDAYRSFVAVSTQWRVGGMGGAPGLDYQAVFSTLASMHRGKSDAERDAIFADLQLIERAALDEMNRKD
ncbi:DUF1799 domain-containing protein [Acidovorax sp. FJL06]|uniref:DUF1799 domain-containing protein n=1 Tax=Acidovorax sp. FJL06 TaxID=2153365 RepID=UPI000F589328|nr:DUF1799 domain-containing protein [Acidovorax sp. FJL06]RQO83484.1 hypothetical protein DBV10_03945 [Acidovorax sp. FJL06]